MISNIPAAVLTIWLINAHRNTWRRIFHADRSPVDAQDLVAAAFALLTSAGLIAASVYLFLEAAPLWLWPLVGLAASGFLFMSARAALGVQEPMRHAASLHR